MSTNGINQEKAEAFAERIMGMLNEGALSLMISIGHRTKLFDTMAILPPATSGQIAEAAGLNERYVREWLAAMVTGGIIDHNPETQTYRLPPEHAAWLTRAATPNNLAVTAQFIGGLGSVEDKVVSAFQNGGGVLYSDYPRFQEVMAEDSYQTVVSALLDGIVPLVPGLEETLRQGIDVLDVGCGSGRAINSLAQAFPNSRFTGYDFSEGGIAAARAEASQKGLSNVRFEVKDVALIDEVEQYDLITAFDAIHDQADPAGVLKNIFTALRPNGTFLAQDIAGSSHIHNNLEHPVAPLLYTVSTMHCMSVSLAQGGAGLGTMWGQEKAVEMFTEAGFTQTEIKQLPHDFMNNFYICSGK